MQNTTPLSRVEAAQFIEDVYGTVIGDIDTQSRGEVFYEGRVQSKVLYADSDTELSALAKTWKEAHLVKNMNDRTGIYPNPADWELRIYNN